MEKLSPSLEKQIILNFLSEEQFLKKWGRVMLSVALCFSGCNMG
jgi:hypothetical protein